MRANFILYPALQQPTPQQQGENVNADKWIYPWSEPVRFKKINVSLIASGSIWEPQPVPPVNPWFASLSEPVRYPRRLHAALNPFQGPIVIQPPGTLEPWFTALTEPVRYPRRLHAALNPFLGPFVPQPPPSATLIQGWYTWLSEPVRQKAGLAARYQQALAYHPRILPTPNVTLVMNATETNNDVALFGINVTSGGIPSTGNAGASVTITEIPAQADGAISIREP